MDEWSGFPDNLPDISEREYTLASQADLILAVTEPLAARLSNRYGKAKVILVPNGCDYDFFARGVALRSSVQSDLVIGYTGSILSWFDWNTVRIVASTYPKARVQLVGPFNQVPNDLPANIEIIGRQPYVKMPFYDASFTVCLIPFIGEASFLAGISPIKLYEYLAAGSPVVSSPFPDAVKLAERGIIHIADSPEAFVKEIKEAAELAYDLSLIARRQSIARENSWAERWSRIEKRVMAKLDSL